MLVDTIARERAVAFVESTGRLIGTLLDSATARRATPVQMVAALTAILGSLQSRGALDDLDPRIRQAIRRYVVAYGQAATEVVAEREAGSVSDDPA